MSGHTAAQTTAQADAHYMDRALILARGVLGAVAPNPAVGCVIVRDGVIVGEGATAPGGRPHAEELALEAAGDQARGAQVYVSLEPCAVRTAGGDACADRLVAAGVARVVVACSDPHPFADGDGIARLQAAGVAVKVGERRREAEALNAGFFLVVRESRPFVAIDPSPESYDVDFDVPADANLLAELRRLAAQGVTRVRVGPDSPLVALLRAADLVDLEPDAARS